MGFYKIVVATAHWMVASNPTVSACNDVWGRVAVSRFDHFL